MELLDTIEYYVNARALIVYYKERILWDILKKYILSALRL